MKQYFFLIVGSFLTSCLPLPTTTDNNTTDNENPFDHKIFQTENVVYESNIKSVILYPEALTDDKLQLLKPAIIHINQSQPLVLEFDELSKRSSNFQVKIFHCDADWKISQLNEIEYLNEVNFFQIRNFQPSFNTKTLYNHYQFALPKVKISGNYVVLVYRNNDEKDIILSKRFVVYENKVRIEQEVRPSSNPSEQTRYQQVQFKINHSGMDLVNPKEAVKVVVRQNYRWDNALTQLRPLFIRESEKILEYTHFNMENNFKGLHEFRRFDLQSIRFLGFNVAEINLSDTMVYIRTETENIRNKRAYTYQPDMNGGYLVKHYETGRGVTEADYIKVTFNLKSPEKANGKVYVLGSFNDWATNEENEMTYQPDNQLYTTQILLKQGEYNYLFGVKANENAIVDSEFFEGTFQDTENQYEVIVYYRPFGARTDMVIGYKSFNSRK